MTPLVSVLMTAYNREKYIAEAIESVLASTYTNFELIIVDDNSSDSTFEIAQRFKDERIKLYRNEKNLGDYPNRNKAASYAVGKYLKYLDSDDLMYSHTLSVMVAAMEKFPKAALAIPCSLTEDKFPYPILVSSQEAYQIHFLQTGLLGAGPSGCLLRTSAFTTLGGFTGKRFIGDIELWLLIAARYPIVKIPPALVWWRQHQEQEIKQENLDFLLLTKFKVMISILESSSNPLNKDEKKEAIRLLKKRQLMNIVRTFLKGKVGLAYSVFRQSQVTILDFFRSIPKNKFSV